MIQKEDVISVAKSISIQLSTKRIDKIIECYPEVEKHQPDVNWSLIVEQLIYDTDGI